MPKILKITIILSASLLALAILGGGCYLFYSANYPLGNPGFPDFREQLKKLPPAGRAVSLIAVGDISYSRGVGRKVAEQRDDNYPFLKIQDYLKNADLVFGNLETPITPGREIQYLEMVFRSNPGTEQALKQAGFSLVSLANNHTPNFGQTGLEDTFKYLDTAGIKYTGAGENRQEANRAVYLESKGLKFAFLAYNDSDVVPASYEAGEARAGTAFMRIDKMTEAVKLAEPQADFVIVSMHSGAEYVSRPNDSQVGFARAAIDAGADLVIGHHPHVVQIMEQYKGKFIFYSLGNFVFDQSWSQETKDGLMLKLYFTKAGLNKISFLPYTMENLAQPAPAGAGDAERILQRLNFPLAERVGYFWNSANNNFGTTSIPTIYNTAQDNQTMALKVETKNLGDNPFCEFAIGDINGDGKNDLVVIEGDGSRNSKCRGNRISVWQWNGRGFSNQWRSEPGNYANLEIEKIDGKNYLIVDTL